MLDLDIYELQARIEHIEEEAKTLYTSIPNLAKIACPELAFDAGELLKKIAQLRELVGG